MTLIPCSQERKEVAAEECSEPVNELCTPHAKSFVDNSSRSTNQVVGDGRGSAPFLGCFGGGLLLKILRIIRLIRLFHSILPLDWGPFFWMGRQARTQRL